MKMTSIVQLTKQIEDIIKHDTFPSSDLINVLHPISSYISSSFVYNVLNEIVSIFLTNKEHQLRFDISDIRSIGNSPISTLTFVNAIVNAFSSTMGSKLTYSSVQSELLVFKMVAYCLLIVIPRGIGRKLNLEEKSAMLVTSLTIYDTLITSQALPGIYSSTQSHMKQELKHEKNVCACSSTVATSEDVAYAKKHVIHLELKGHVQTLQDQNDLAKRIRTVERKIKK